MRSNEREVYKQFIPIDKRTIQGKKDGVKYEWFSMELSEEKSKEFMSQYNFTFEETTPHYVKIEWNLEQLINDELLQGMYPFLYRVIKRRLHFLSTLIEESRDKIVSPVARIEGNYYFFASARYLASQYFSTYNTWNRNISIFCTLGLVNKVKTDNRMIERRTTRETKALAKRLDIDHEKLSPPNFYTIPIYNDELLTEANHRAKVLLDNNFRTNGFSKNFLIRVFGQEFADTIFHDERQISEYSQNVQSKIEEFILKDINRQGYTTKDRVLRYVHIDYSQLLPWEYGVTKEKQNKKAILGREFDRSISEIKDKYNLEYKKANKELKERFKLAKSKTIIYAKENNL
ncbi:hypothetical protein J7E81_15925 [Bacillus sp. ISL-18]|uniref:hypothetical protein n=1 Tax=Bacillus sp. ISL-18 TaxID=2819118 RepID=UPI001BE99D2A|nr:hypothetical protein [Bacillus sp. ISL-18]MBT2656708.1 hypothetical protein [Bacillus sp. ISL-18]